MRAATLLCMAALALTALAMSSDAAQADGSRPLAGSCPEAPEAQYFPAGAIHPDWKDGDLFVRRWYSEHLAVMEEPSLSCGPLEATEAYRFLWLRTFHNPIAVRVYRRSDDYRLQAVILDGAGGYKAGKVSHRVTKELSPDQWQTVIARLEEVRLWHMPTQSHDLPGKDGAQWIVEGRRDGRYHVVDRWSDTDRGLESVGKLFLDLAGLSDVRPVY